METVNSLIKRTPEMVMEAFYGFFRPFWGSPINIEKTYYKPEATRNDLFVPLKVVDIYRDSACYNQGAFSQYWYLASQKHKKLRLAFENNESIEVLKSIKKELFDFLNIEFHKAAINNFKLIQELFRGRHKVGPRICIKGYFKTHEDNVLITVFRDRHVDYEAEINVENNTGFLTVHKTGRYYLCNNIYDEALRGNYVNPRLKPNVEGNTVFDIVKSKNKKLIEIWKNPYNSDGSLNSYNSTLIVPMTFWNNSLNKEFLEELDIFPNKKRTIFGFLCLDHVSAGYFKEEFDVSNMYQFADSLSQYLFARLVFTDISKTSDKIDKIINERVNNVILSRDDINGIVNSLPFNINKSVKNIETTSEEENFSYKIDDNLIEYIKAISSGPIDDDQ